MPRLLVDHHKAPLFTADRTVGRNAPNDRLDVLLVQFLLFLCTNNPKGFGAPIETLSAYDDLKVGRRVATPVFRATIAPTHPKPEGNIFIDGICGDQTISFIEYFQEQMLLRRRGVELNGQVAPQGTAGTTTNATAQRVIGGYSRPMDAHPSPWVPQRAPERFLLLNAFGSSRAERPKASHLRFRSVRFSIRRRCRHHLATDNGNAACSNQCY